jgi:S-DNA-T family DNA segregation ATPase FtsK/SpoIIIE
VHLLFATQQPSNSKIKPGLRANLTYWLSLRVVDPDDSKLMINSKDAATISNSTPGRGYKRIGKDVVRFQSAIVTLPYIPNLERSGGGFFRLDATGRKVSPHEAQKKEIEERQRAAMPPNREGTLDGTVVHLGAERKNSRELIDQLVHEEAAAVAPSAKRLTDADKIIAIMHQQSEYQPQEMGKPYAATRYRIWEEPLTSTLVLSELGHPRQTKHVSLQVEIGYLDNPEKAAIERLELHLTENGSVLALGGAQTGKTSFLRTCILALARAYSPGDVAFYLVDSAGTGFGFSTSGGHNSAGQKSILPHIADIVKSIEATKIERLFNVLQDEYDEREIRFQQANVDSWKDYRAAQPEVVLPALIVAIDNLLEFAELNPDVLKLLGLLIRRGQRYGIYFILTTDRLNATIPNDIKNSISQKIILRVNSEDDSTTHLGKAFAYRLKPQDYGRGYMSAGTLPREVQIAYPTLRPLAEVKARLNPNPRAAGQLLTIAELKVQEELAYSVEQIVVRWGQQRSSVPSLELLPQRIPTTLTQWNEARSSTTPRLGVATDNRNLQMRLFDLRTTPHLMISGGPRTGKSNLLQTILAGLVYTLPPSGLLLYLIDYRANVLRPFAPASIPHTRFYATETAQLSKSLSEGEVFFQQLDRDIQVLKQADMNDQPLPYRIVIAISNIDLLEANDLAHLAKLSRWVVQGKRLGIHFIITSSDFSSAGSHATFKMLKQERSAVMLGTADIPAANIGLSKNLKWPTNLEAVPGRGFLIEAGSERMLQFWYTDQALLDGLSASCRRDPSALSELPPPEEAPSV